MRNFKKGFVTHLFVGIVTLLIIGIGLYFYLLPILKTEKIDNYNSVDKSDFVIPNLKSNNDTPDKEIISEPNKIQTETNYNIGTIPVRAIVANINETGDKYGSYGLKFNKSKLDETDQALQKLNDFVEQSSLGKAKLQWTTSGVYELGSGVCDHESYGDKVNDLIQRALIKADSQSPLVDYSYYVIVHPMPNCSNGEAWTFEGRGQFEEYNLNGKKIHLRGIHISDLSDQYLFHEFGHTLAYKPNTGIGHPDYLNCPIVKTPEEVKINITNSCPRLFDFNNYDIPIFTMMSNVSIMSDYSAPEKEIAGWLTDSEVIVGTKGDYVLSPLEQLGPSPKAIKILIPDTKYSVYVSFRQPNGYIYPNNPTSKPNGVIMDIVFGGQESFLITNSTNKNLPLQIGVSYRLGVNGPVIKLNSINNNLASISVK